MSDKELPTLNESCPFGNRSTRYFSSLGKAPELGESREANSAIMNVLNKLAAEVKRRDPPWQPIAITEYDQIAKVSHTLSPHSPSQLAEIFPIDTKRTCEYVLNAYITPRNTILANALAVAYLEELDASVTKKVAARNILGELAAHFSDFIVDKGEALDLSASVRNTSRIKQGEGVQISAEDFEMLIHFQDLQERFEDAESIERLNNHGSTIPIMEIILGIQKSICTTLQELKSEDPEWFQANSVAFEEISLVNERGDVVPSSRLLKLILHNIGEYIITTNGESTPEKVLFNALQEALKHNVFHQRICIFEETEAGIRFDGVIDKVCPARVALTQMIMNQLTSRMLT